MPQPVPPTTHDFKYRLVYSVGGKRVIGFDNERGKGDHRYDGEQETPYVFIDVATLLSDFWRAIDEQGEP